MKQFLRRILGRPIVLEVKRIRLQGIDNICFVTTGILTSKEREQIKEQWEQYLSSKGFAAQTTNTSGKSLPAN